MGERQPMGRGLTILTAAAIAGALALPLVFVSAVVISFFSMSLAIYVSVSWLVGEVMLTLSSGIALRLTRGAPNEASRFEKVPHEPVRAMSTMGLEEAV